MPDREKVIKALECCTSADGCCDCPYGNNRRGTDHCQLNSTRDALILLREQEPVKTEEGHAYIYCGACHTALSVRGNPKPWKYCPWCGREVKWNA